MLNQFLFSKLSARHYEDMESKVRLLTRRFLSILSFDLFNFQDPYMHIYKNLYSDIKGGNERGEFWLKSIYSHSGNHSHQKALSNDESL